jgi:methylamine---glutamate N-methyltransferase subunit C
MPDGDIKTKKPLARDPYRLGNSFVFPPHVIDDIHIKAELGRYRMRGMSLFKKIPHWDDLTFLPGTLTRFVIEGYREKCETRTVIGPRAKRPIELDIPVYITGMSFGALSATRRRPPWRAARPWRAPRPVRERAA